jgi:uncharacterized iron-regulated membrane protein
MRKTISLIHRYVGLVLTLFLIVVGLTGSVLAFLHPLDRWLNDDLMLASPASAAPGTTPLDPVALRERAAALVDPRGFVPVVILNREPDENAAFYVQARIDPKTGKEFMLPYNELYIDPVRGTLVGTRLNGEVGVGRRAILGFLYRLHYSLALPESTGRAGSLIMGIVALLWTIDCFVGFYLTLPARAARKARASATDAPARTMAAGRGWWQRWKPAWLIKWSGGAYRINFDIHRAFGLWTWAMLFVFAWSSVAFNLNEVYLPVMKTLTAVRTEPPEQPKRTQPLFAPALDWTAALARGRALTADLARRQGLRIDREDALSLDTEHGLYALGSHAASDWGRWGSTGVSFDADTGALRDESYLAQERAGDTIGRWLFMLHMAAVGGLAMQIFVCAMGLAIMALCVTGVVVWLKKRKAERALRANRRARRIDVGIPSPVVD